MTRTVLAVLMLALLPGCGLYGSYDALRYAGEREAEEAKRLDQPAEIMWTESIYNTLDATIVVKDPRASLSETAPDTVTVSVRSSTDETPKAVTLTETGKHTGIFRGSVALARSFGEDGLPVASLADRLLVNADQAEVRLEAVYTSSKGMLQAQSTYIEKLMHFGVALEADGVTPLPGATVTLARSGLLLASTISRPDGTYAFYGLAAGSYTVTFSQNGVPVGQSKVYNL